MDSKIDVATRLGEIAKSLLATVADLKLGDDSARKALGTVLDRLAAHLLNAVSALEQRQSTRPSARALGITAALLRGALVRLIEGHRAAEFAEAIDDCAHRFPASAADVADLDAFVAQLRESADKFTVIADIVRSFGEE